MGKRGPVPKPEWLRVITNNPGKRPLENMMKAQPAETLAAPENFNDVQREMWNHLCDILKTVNALTCADTLLMARYVEFLYMYRLAADWMQERSSGSIVYAIKDKNGTQKSIRMLPQLKAMLEISNHLLRIEQQFGLTPASRAAIMIPGGAGDGGLDFDPFA